MELEAELRRLQPNPLRVQLNGLIREAEAKARIYVRLFAINIQPILDHAYCAAQGSGESKYMEMVRDRIGDFERNYNEARRSEIDTAITYLPFISIRTIIPRLKAALDSSPNESYAKLEEELFAIKALGSACMDEVRQLATKIRRFEGMDTYQVKVMAPEGHMEVIA